MTAAVAPAQGMMLSERPTRSVGGNFAASAAAAPSIGNYKGVMLCNRPFAGVMAAARSGDAPLATGAKHAFVTGVVSSEMGFAGKPPPREHRRQRNGGAVAVLGRHRKWLLDLQRTKDTLEEEYLEEAARKAEAKKRFMAREGRNRAIARGVAVPPPGCDDDFVRSHSAPEFSCSDRESNEDAGSADEKKAGSKNDGAGVGRRRGRKGRRKHGGAKYGAKYSVKEGSSSPPKAAAAATAAAHPKRPMWAKTAAAVEAEAVEDENGEVDSLLEFTRSLDFEKYIRDSEVQDMIDRVKRRIATLEGAAAASATETKGEDRDAGGGGSAGAGEADEEEEENAILGRQIARLTRSNLRSLSAEQKDDGDGDGAGSSGGGGAPDAASVVDDAMSVARSVLSQGEKSVRSIHSARSLAAVAERAKQKIVEFRLAPVAEMDAKNAGDGGGCGEAAVVVKTVTHKDDGGLRAGRKVAVSNLPYMHRNPAV
ncbi:unnamed protein product [Phaeothamnion confervicola]